MLWRDVAFLAIVALLPLYAAQFGVGNQVEQFALIERLRDPLFARGDFYVDSAAVLGQPRYYYALAMSWFAAAASLPIAVHVAAFLTNLLLGMTSFVAARRIFAASATGAAAAAAMIVLNGSFSLGFAGYLSFESFQPASFAIAVVLSGVTLLLLGHRFAAAGCFILAGLAHPTIGVEIALIAFAATGMTDIARARSVFAVLPLVMPGLLFLLSMVVAWAVPNLDAGAYRMPAASFFDIIAYRRAPHHYLGLEMPGMAWFHATLFVVGICAIYGHALRRLGMTRERVALAVMAALVIAVCLASLWFVDVAHNRLWVTAQVFRMLLLVKWVGFLVIGWLIGSWLISPRPAYLFLAGTLVAVNADAEPRALILVLLAALAIGILRPGKIMSAGVVLVTLGLSLYFQHKYGIDKQALRLAVACLVIALIYLAPLPSRLSLATAAALGLTFIAFGYVTRAHGLLGKEDLAATYDWQDHRDDAADIARKAAATSPAGSVWLAPPNMEAFRLISRRAVLVDFTSIPFEDRAMIEWQRRVESLYGPITGTGFVGRHQMEDNHRDHPALAQARKLGAQFAVLDAKTDWNGPVLASNASFKAVRIP